MNGHNGITQADITTGPEWALAQDSAGHGLPAVEHLTRGPDAIDVAVSLRVRAGAEFIRLATAAGADLSRHTRISGYQRGLALAQQASVYLHRAHVLAQQGNLPQATLAATTIKKGMTGERLLAAQAIGLTPLPQVNDNVDTKELDTGDLNTRNLKTRNLKTRE